MNGMIESGHPAESDQSLSDLVLRALQQADSGELRDLLAANHPADLARVLEHLAEEVRPHIWLQIDDSARGEVLLELSESIRDAILDQMEPQELLLTTENLDPDEQADLIAELPEGAIDSLLSAMRAQDRQRLEQILSYPDDSAGGLMNTDTISVRSDLNVDVVLRYLRRRGRIPQDTDKLIVVDRTDHYIGVVALTDLLTQLPETGIAELMASDVPAIPVDMPASEVAQLFEDRDLISAPVVNPDGELVGRITIDDVVDVMRSEADHSFMGMAGLAESEDVFTPVLRGTRRRSLWLSVNLVTAFLASWVIGQFDQTIEKMVALAVLMPIVASMGGNAGGQSLALAIRGLALGQVTRHNLRKLLIKETQIGMLGGLIWALVVAVVVAVWFQDYHLSAVIGAAMLINLIFAAAGGFLIPVVLNKLGADPALASTVVLTTLTDVVGFLTFLGLAALFLV
ncbi:MAG: magnesium transporter [Gammaproteobacteria bacterium]|nr:magnesium transporter [Gammaproteobacteria bacterium]